MQQVLPFHSSCSLQFLVLVLVLTPVEAFTGTGGW